MSSVTTPSRVGRSQMVPSLDTKPTAEEITTALSYAGLHTPPHSANESRRPSTQYSWFDGSCPSYGTVFSQPTTPVNRTHHGHGNLEPSWSDVDALRTAVSSQLIDTPFGNSSFRHDAVHTTPANSFVSYSVSEKHGIVDPFALHYPSALSQPDAWSQSTASMFGAQMPCLASDLFDTPHSHPSERTANSQYYNPRQSITTLRGGSIDGNILGSAHEPANQDLALYHHPQVVVPSLLAPQDVYYQSQFAEYSSPESSNEGFIGGLPNSAANSFGSFEMMSTPSPMDMYFDHAESEYLLVKAEETSTDTKPYHPRTVKRSPFAPRRPGSKRSRNEKRAWHEHESGGIQVKCEGREFDLSKPIKVPSQAQLKPFKCEHILPSGKECSSRFQRAEHLKRHVGSHSLFRAYRCPLPDCTWGIGRSDNACDHFKTHLKPKTKGKRNLTVEWHVLHQAILEKFDEAHSEKLITNLSRWIERGMPPSGGTDRRMMDIVKGE
ncbi:hypothetical protein BDY17DRAFT_322450 [Neohortaea acidophila]|uniref:C2H2-type domain-containing protein n=1 Tax=Neohortaea acidophila TaxID=245834 RepID=A0A6A6PZP8_9PEZI|nr:uncharacterized protein BDY17DRAFT_322450 [Neohortaea acidophila]KAF2485620.1 hypothetical protein BDY17DRAFT_322450 [Neohortaea acidophila]